MLKILINVACLSVIAALVSITEAHCQQAGKSRQSEGIDYKQVGAPLPNLIFFAYNDTSAAAKVEKKKEKKKRKRKAALQDTLGYSIATAKQLDNGRNLFIMLFNPTCLHCEDMTYAIEKNIEVFKDNNILLLASKPMIPYIADFSERHNISSYPNMYIGYDSSGYIDDAFLYQRLPQLNIYDSKRKLLKIFSGDVPIDSLKKYIK